MNHLVSGAILEREHAVFLAILKVIQAVFFAILRQEYAVFFAILKVKHAFLGYLENDACCFSSDVCSLRLWTLVVKTCCFFCVSSSYLLRPDSFMSSDERTKSASLMFSLNCSFGKLHCFIFLQ